MRLDGMHPSDTPLHVGNFTTCPRIHPNTDTSAIQVLACPEIVPSNLMPQTHAQKMYRWRASRFSVVWGLLVSMGLSAANEDCLFEAENGAVYDLRPMEGYQFKVPAVDQQYTYTLSTCGPVKEAPPECASIAPTRSTAAFQVGHGLCFYLGDPKMKMWSSIDRRPELGFDLVYGNGEHCSDGRAREIRCVPPSVLARCNPLAGERSN